MTLAELGLSGMARLIERQAAMGELLRDRLETIGWRLVNDSPLAVVCFTHREIESGRKTAAEVVDHMVGRGRVWVSQVRLGGSLVALRACITSHRTEANDVEVLVEELQRSIGPP